jgi:hypothetical protein
MWWGNIEMFFDDVFVNANFSAAVTLTLTEVPCKSTPRTKAHTKISVKSPLTSIKHHGKSG